ncbi:MAG: T9SS type A sorting domain-containing protein, partial [Candidatus Brocadiia bacterium]
MKKLLLTIFILLFVGDQILFNAECLGQTQLRSATLSTAGGTTRSDSYKLISLVGQAVEAGSSSSTNYKMSGSLLAITRDLEVPNIVPPAPITVPQAAGQDIAISTTITDNVNVDEAILYYRSGDQTAFTGVTMTKDGDSFSGSIPGANVGETGVAYYVSATDVNTNVSQTDVYSVRVILTGTGIVSASAQDAGSAQTAYRMVSIPLDATNKSPEDVLVDNLGSYDKTKWRFYELRADQSYAEYPNTANMSAGKGFWLIVKSTGKIIDTGPGNTNMLDDPFEVSLVAGWNIVGNPFNFDVPIANVAMQNDSSLDIRAYTGSWSIYNGSLRPFEGYAVYSEAATKLLIDPDLSGSGKIPAVKKPVSMEENAWTIAIDASCQEAVDKDTRAITFSSASAGYDRFDRPEPPLIGEYVSVYFPHTDWNKMSTKYCVDARPQPIEGDIWEFEVITNIREKVQLCFKGLESVSRENEVWLVDEMLKVTQNLREQNSYAVSVNQDHPRKLLLVVGKSGFIKDSFNAYDLIPVSYMLYQNYPNPFNPLTTIRFGLPSDDQVTLKVYNLLGQEVVTLLNDADRPAGYHSIIWDGKNRLGATVSSGMYIYSLKTNTFSDVKK